MLSRLAAMAWRNLRRNLRRTLITTAALAGGLALSMAGWVLTDGMLITMVDSMVSSTTGHVQILPMGQLKESNVYDFIDGTADIVAQLEQDPRVKGIAPRIHGAGLLAAGDQSTGVEVLAVDPKREGGLSRVPEQVIQGRFVQNPAEVVLGAGVARELKVGLKDEILIITQATDGSIGNALWTVVGIATTGSDMQDRSTAWISLDEAKSLMVLDGAHRIVVRLQDPDDTEAMLSELLERPGWTGVYADRPPETEEEATSINEPHITALDPDAQVVVRTWRAANPVMASYYSMSQSWTYIMVLIILATAGLGTMNTLLMSVLERTRELGILRAVGLKPDHMVILVMLESFWLGVLSIGLGLLGGWALCSYLVQHGIDLSGGYGDLVFAGVSMEPVFYGVWSTPAWVVPVVSLLFISFLSSLLPAIRAARLKPVDAMGRR